MQKQLFSGKRLASAAFFGFVMAFCSLVIFPLSPGWIGGIVFGLIPFEGEAISVYVAVASVINFLFFMFGFYCVALMWNRTGKPLRN
jgi:hypothetical protein